jgi:hypothetical protein
MQAATEYSNQLAQNPQALGQWREGLQRTGLTAAQHFEQKLKEMTFGETQQHHRATEGIATATLGETQRSHRVNEGIAGGHLGVARQRLAFDQTAPKGVLAQDLGLVVDPRTGVGTPITNNGVAVNPSATKPLTEVQGNATNFAGRMTSAEAILDGLEAKGVNSGQLRTMAAGSAWTNFLASPEGQSYRQAAENWVTANLRKESGAAIGIQEMNKEIKKYFPIPGDSPATVEQKRQARAVAKEGMLVQAGPGAKQVPGIVQRGTGAPAQPTGAATTDISSLMQIYGK